MLSNERIIDRIEEECTLPDGWKAYQTQGRAGGKYIEVSGYDGESLQDRIVELIPGEQPEIAIFHKQVTGRTERILNEDDAAVSGIPSSAGAFIVNDIDSAIAASDVLADLKTLDLIAERRNSDSSTESLPFDEALQEAGIDSTTVVTTFESV